LFLVIRCENDEDSVVTVERIGYEMLTGPLIVFFNQSTMSQRRLQSPCDVWYWCFWCLRNIDHYFRCRKQPALTFNAGVDVTWDDYGTIATYVCPPGWYFADGGTRRTL